MVGLATGGFVGRTVEVGVLRGLVAGVVAGRGGSVLVEGEAGIGKSALVLEGLAGAVGAGCRVFWCVADSSWQRLPLRVLVDGLGVDVTEFVSEELVSAFGGPGDPVSAMAERLLAVVDRLCVAAPVVLVLDDLQWADEASLVVWSRLSRSLDQSPLLLVAVGRSVPRRAELVRLRRGLVDARSVVLSLGPLARPEVVELVGGLVGARVGPGLEQLVVGAGGNPLFVRESVQALRRADRVRVVGGVADVVDGGSVVPVSLAEAIGGRLRILSEKTVPLVRSAASLGAEFAVVDLATVVGVAVPQLVAGVAEAVAAGVLVESGGRLAFGHPLIRQALYESVPAEERAGLHRRAARALAEVGAPVDRVAQQLLAVPDAEDDWVADWLGRHVSMLTARAPKVAAELLDRAVQGMPEDDERWEGLATSLVSVLRLLARFDEVERIARPVWQRATDPARAGQVAFALAYALAATGRPEEGLAVTGQTLARQAGVDGWTARLRAMHARMTLDLERFDDASAVAQQAIAEGERAGDRFAVSFALHVLSLIAGRGDHLGSQALNDRALAVAADDPESQHLRLLLHRSQAISLRRLGRTAEAERAVREGLVLAERIGTPRRVSAHCIAASFYFFLGRWDDAVAELEIAIEVLDELPSTSYFRLEVYGLLALIAGHRDDQPAMDTHLAAVRGLELTTRSLRSSAEFLLLARALAEERTGYPIRAVGILAQVLQPDFARDMDDRPECLPTLVRLALALGDTEVTRAATQACVDEAERDPDWRNTAAASRCRGLLDGDVARLGAAVDGYRTAGHLAVLAETLEDLAVVCAERGELDDARAAYAESVEAYRGMGAAWDVRRAQARLQPFGIGGDPRGAQARPTTGWYALTRTEVTVARLVASGLSNPDIASELFLSRRTVQSHVSHILAKLNAQSRREIAEEVGSLGVSE